jgi:N-acetylmuramoyl-L-alanine amidase
MIMLVAVNAGHCQGQDPGAVGRISTEANLTVQYAKSVCDYLNAVGINTIYIHENSLSQICRIANDNDADLFYSLHFNSASNPAATGTETYYYEGSQRGQIFAQCVQNQLVSTLGLYDRGIKTNGLYVTRNTNMCSILIEVGFINNPTEEKFLIDHMDDACRAIARGITDAIQKLYSSQDVASSGNTTQSNLKPGMASKYFSIDEVSCHCCGTNGTQPILLQFMDELREATGHPLECSCAFRGCR